MSYKKIKREEMVFLESEKMVAILDLFPIKTVSQTMTNYSIVYLYKIVFDTQITSS